MRLGGVSGVSNQETKLKGQSHLPSTAMCHMQETEQLGLIGSALLAGGGAPDKGEVTEKAQKQAREATHWALSSFTSLWASPPVPQSRSVSQQHLVPCRPQEVGDRKAKGYLEWWGPEGFQESHPCGQSPTSAGLQVTATEQATTYLPEGS